MSRLYECISEMKKGSPSGYDAETGEESAGSEKLTWRTPWNTTHYIGFDVHKKTISFCIKTAAGEIVEEGSACRRNAPCCGNGPRRTQAWQGAMEATLFSGWIYDTLKPYGVELEMAHPAKLKAISAGKKKSDTIDARTIADLVRCNLLPACYVAPPRIRRTAPLAALSQPGGERSGAHEEQDGRATDGNRRPICEREIAPQEIFCQPAGENSKRCRNR